MGIQSFSKPSRVSVLFSCNKFQANHVSGFLTAKGFDFKHCVGSYKGKVENSWWIYLDDLKACEFLLEGEESILLLDSPNSLSQYRATLRFLDGSPDIDLGRFRSVTESEAKSQEAWTYAHIPQGNGYKPIPTYFVCYHNDAQGNPIKE